MGEKGLNTRAEILRAYNDLVYEKGIKRVTVRAIAKRAGVSIGNLYYYFKKKSDLGYALSRDYYAKVNIILGECLTTSTKLEKVFVEYYTGILLYCKIDALHNYVLECADDLTLIEPQIEALNPIVEKAIMEENLMICTKKIALATRALCVIHFTAHKFNHINGLEHIPREYFKLICGVFFSILQLPAKPYTDRMLKHIEQLDEKYIIDQIYTLQNYDYEFLGEIN